MKSTIKLIKKSVPDDKIIKDDREIHAEVIDNVGIFYYKISTKTKPDWVDGFFLGRLNCRDKIRVASVAGVLLVARPYEAEDRIFAITFGSGRFLLEDNVIEERFGLRIALNSIKYDSLRSIDFKKMEGVPSTVRNQASRLTGIENFNINTQVNLLKSITGTLPDDRQDEIGTSMTGADSLSLSSSMTVNSVTDKLDQLYTLYKSEAYKQHFAWVDNISAIRDSVLISTLDNVLIKKINNRELEDVWLALPAIVDWSEICYLKYSRGDCVEHDDVNLKTAIEDAFVGRNDIQPSDFKNTKVKIYNDQNSIIKEWSLYKCLCGEIIYENKLYILDDGGWFMIDNSFYKAIEQVYNGILPSDVNFIRWRPRIDDGVERFEFEKDYNVRLSDSDEKFCNMDRDLVHLQNDQAKIEFCDVYSQGGHIIHVKRSGGSELIGHMFNQGLVSASLLMTDVFRKKLNEKLKMSHREAWCVPQNRRDFDAGRYCIVFGVLSKDDGERVKIPFFSKVLLREVVTTLRNYGFKIYMNNISKERTDDAQHK